MVKFAKIFDGELYRYFVFVFSASVGKRSQILNSKEEKIDSKYLQGTLKQFFKILVKELI